MKLPIWASILVLLIGLASNAHGVLIFEKGKDVETRGYLIEKSEILVKIREVLPDGRLAIRSIPQNEIDLMIQAVDQKRLAELDPEKPQTYRDYAEELAEKKKDPDAHVTAIRLYLIAAYLAPDTLGRSSCLGLVALARSPREARLFRGLAYLLDPNHDRGLLRKTGTPPAAEKVDDAPPGFDSLLLGLRRLQAEDRRLALKEIEKPGVKKAMLPYRHIMLYEELFLICQQRTRAVSNDDVRKILALEVSLLKDRQNGVNLAAASQLAGRDPDWSTIVYTNTAKPVFSASLTHATEFDPRLSQYVDGSWVKPTAKPE